MKRLGLAIFLICLLVFTTGCSKNYVELYEAGEYSEAYSKARESANKYSNNLNGSYSSTSSAKRDAAEAAKAYYYMAMSKKALGNTREANDYLDLAAKENIQITLSEVKYKQIWVDGHYENQWISGGYERGPYIPGHYEQNWVEGHYDTTKIWIDGHYEGNVWVDGHYDTQQVWVDGHNEDVWVDGHTEDVWVDGHYEDIYVEGKYETKAYTVTKAVTVNVVSEWSQRAKTERGRTTESVTANDASAPEITNSNLQLLRLDMESSFNRYKKLLDEGKDSEAAKKEWFDAKMRYESAKE